MYILVYWTFLLLAVDHVQTIGMYLEPALTYTFYEAVDGCKQLGMELAILNTQAKYDEAYAYIKSVVPGLSNVWIGYKIKDVAKREFEWINGETMQFDTPWGTKDPNDIGVDCCVRILLDNDYGLADTSCSNVYNFLCTGNITTTEAADTIETTEKRATTAVTVRSTTPRATTTDTDKTTEKIVISTFRMETSDEMFPTIRTLETTDTLTSTSDSYDKSETTGFTTEAADTDKTTESLVPSDTTGLTSKADDTDKTTVTLGTTTDSMVTSKTTVLTTKAADSTATGHCNIISYNGKIVGAGCMCQCGNVTLMEDYKNYTFKELQIILAPITDQLRKNLLVDKRILSAYIYKHKTRKDNRPSARRLGYVGVTVLVAVGVLIILSDVSSWYRK